MRSSVFAVLLSVGAGLTLWQPALAHDSFLHPLGPIAAAQRAHLIRVTAITMIAILPVLVGVPLIIWRYRHQTGKGQYRPQWAFYGPLEVTMWGVPFVIISVLAWWLWHESRTLDPYSAVGPAPLEIQAIGLDWKWLFLYPSQSIATLGEIVVPVDRPVRISLTTDTVMQSFRVSALAGQIYAMPGMRTEVNFSANRPGTARGQNTQFNGDGFAKQNFVLRAVDADTWSDWTTKAAPMQLDQATYALLAERATPEATSAMLDVPAGPIRFGNVPPGLFDSVIARYHSGQAVPPQDQPGAPSYVPAAHVPNGRP